MAGILKKEETVQFPAHAETVEFPSFLESVVLGAPATTVTLVTSSAVSIITGQMPTTSTSTSSSSTTTTTTV